MDQLWLSGKNMEKAFLNEGSGPVRKVAHCEFQYIPYDCGMDNPKRSHNAWIAAVKPATATHKRVVQPIRVLLP